MGYDDFMDVCYRDAVDRARELLGSDYIGPDVRMVHGKEHMIAKLSAASSKRFCVK